MMLGSSPRALLDAASWHLRGLVATEAGQRARFRARGLWQPAEIEARRGLARELATELLPELQIDPQTGYLLLPDSALPDLGEVCEIGRAVLSKARTGNGEHLGGKTFFHFRLAPHEQRLALLRVGLDRRLLAMAATYFGVLPVIAEADYLCSLPVSGPFTKSQLWHCDDDSGDVLKIFIYCEDVETRDGPFELVESTASSQARRAVGYRYAGRRYRVADDVMDRHVPRAQQLAIEGPRATAFVVDTVRCFHRGSRIVDAEGHRIVGMICYCPATGIRLPRRLATGRAPLVEFTTHFPDPIQRAALGAPVAPKWI